MGPLMMLMPLLFWIGVAHRVIVDQRMPAGPGDSLRENGSWT